MNATRSDARVIAVAARKFAPDLLFMLQTAGYGVQEVSLLDDPAHLSPAQRNMLSRADAVIVDARAALEPAALLLKLLMTQERGPARPTILLLSERRMSDLDRLVGLGAHHFLVAPFVAVELAQTVRIALRTAQQIQRQNAAESVVAVQERLQETPRWTWEVGTAVVKLSESLRPLLDLAPYCDRLTIGALWLGSAPQDRRPLARAFLRCIKTSTPVEVTHRFAHANGVNRLLRHRIRPIFGADGKPQRLTGLVDDLNTATARADADSHLDTLTGFANQASTRGYLRQLIEADATSPGNCVALLVVVHKFEQLNAGFGRTVADLALQSVARRLQRTVQALPGNNERLMLARLGGGEFLIIDPLPREGEPLSSVGQALAASFERPFLVAGEVLHLSCRIGIAQVTPAVHTPDQLLQNAATAAESLRSEGPNSVRVYQPGDVDPRSLRKQLDADLRTALADNQLTLAYQPQVRIATGVLKGMEALVRWRHPKFGVVHPEMVVEVAQNSDLLMPLADHVLRRSLADAHTWPEGAGGPLSVAVNFSGAVLPDPRIVDVIATALRDLDFPAHRLTVEVTETDLVTNLEAAAHNLQRVRDLGATLAIDDFGAGYSSLAYLKALPLDYLKVDRQFVADLDRGGGRDQALLHSVIALAHSLGMAVIAEGVETASQLDHLAREGCDFYQGYLCAAPLPAEEVAAFIADFPAASA